MELAINPGTVLIKKNALLPAEVSTESDAYLPGWQAVRDLDGYALSRRIEQSNWHFFSLAGDIRSTVLGLARQTTVRRAIKRIVAKSAGERFNSLEITEIVSARFLGLPCVRVTSRLRHIQESLVLVPAREPQGKSAVHVVPVREPVMVLQAVAK